MLKGRFLSFDGGGTAAILEGVDLVSVFVGRPHGRFDAAIGKEPGQDDVPDAVLPQQKVEIGGMESAQTRLALDEKVPLLRSHFRTNGRTPFVSRKGLSLLDTRQNPVRVGRYLLVTLYTTTIE